MHGFHQRQTKAFNERGEHQRAGVGVGMFEAGVAEVVEHEQAPVKLWMIAHTGKQGIALPADLPGDTQPCRGTGGPGAF
ncbi:hypothetical protein D3C81_2012200 [compost metagenome]